MTPDAPDGPPELRHEHECPGCHQPFVCFVMMCRSALLRTTERCWPCRQAGRASPEKGSDS